PTGHVRGTVPRTCPERTVEGRRRAGLRLRSRAHARLDGRRGAAADARDGRGLVLEPLTASALAQGRDFRKHAGRRRAPRRLRRRRDLAAREAGWARLPHRLSLVLRSLALATCC